MIKFLTATVLFIAAPAQAQVASSAPTGASVQLVQSDSLLRIFPDRPSPPKYEGVAHVPRGGAAPKFFAVTSPKDRTCQVTASVPCRADGTPLRGHVLIYELLPVHVEGNVQGSKCSKPGGAVPEGWLAHLVREAPFDTGEVMVSCAEIKLRAGATQGLLIDVQVERDASPGLYEGNLKLTGGDAAASASFSIRVHSTELPGHYALHATHWLSPDPVNLTNASPPEWWSERHWKLLAHAGTQLRAFGDDSMFTPLVEGEQPLIQVTQIEDGSYTFDYTRFDRWVTLFRSQGFRLFAGQHLNNMGRSVFVRNKGTGKLERPFLMDQKQKAWLAFLSVFLRDYHQHLKQKGWLDCFLQHQYDEPKDEVLYAAISGAVRENLAGVGSIDAINSRPETFSPLVDNLVFNLPGLLGHDKLAAAREAGGKRNWLYHCTSPYPPYPNRHIDGPLTESRLWPWICAVYKAQGYLFWAANNYRGTEDEYAQSLGPMGPLKAGQKLSVGHPPGDNWFYYRGPEGLRPSVRMLAFREGLVDHTLLSMLAQRDPERARALQDRIVAGVVGQLKPYPKDWSWGRYREQVNYLKATYSRTPDDYHAARAEMLNALEQLN